VARTVVVPSVDTADRGSAPRGGGWRVGPGSGRRAVSPRCAACDRTAFLPARDAAVTPVEDPESAIAHLLPSFAGADRERCVVLLLDTKHRLLEAVTVSIGSIDHTFMSPREVFRDALMGNAAAVVLAHNHPSGDPEPSRDDERVTARLSRAGRLVGVEVLDHLVLGGHEWVSLARRGLV
jgi:DNA repair protein RadC